MMDTSRLFKQVRILIYGGDRVYFVPLLKQGVNEVHPEIVDIPGRIKDDSNSHGLALVMRTFTFLRSDKWSNF
jgi:hypothetical protein